MRKISEDMVTLYRQYFYSLDVISNVDWAPSIICTRCLSNLNQWKKTEAAMLFGIPMIWTNPNKHNKAECYACVNYIFGTNRNKASSLSYIATRWAQLPIAHSETVPIPKRPSPTDDYLRSTFQTMDVGESSVSMYQPSHVTPQCNHIEIGYYDTPSQAITATIHSVG